MKRLLLSTLLTLCIALALLPAAVRAQDIPEAEYTYDIINGEAVITGLKLTGWAIFKLNIPSTIDGYPVTEIADNAFNGNDYHFGVSEITIPSTVQRIGKHAFFGHRVIDNTVIRIPASVKEIGAYAFSYLRGITAFEVDAGNSSYKSVGGVLFSNDLATLYNYPLAKTDDTYITPKETLLLYCTCFGDASNLKNLIVRNPNVRRMGFTFAYCDLKIYGDNSISPITPDGLRNFGKIEFISDNQQYSSILGDLDNNKALNSNDLMLLYQYVNGVSALNGLALIPADFNQDGFVNQLDVYTMYSSGVREFYPFTDVSFGQYYADAVTWAVASGITVGTGDNQFSPTKACTEVEILTMLHRAANKPVASASAPITVAGYCQDAVNWAYEQGMIDSGFAPGTPCTRASAVKFIWQAFGSEGAAASGFSDVPADCAAAVNWAVANGITVGTGGHQFTPDRTCTREEIVTLLHRAYVPEFRLAV